MNSASTASISGEFSGLVLGQLEIDSKTNEIPAVRELADELDWSGDDFVDSGDCVIGRGVFD